MSRRPSVLTRVVPTAKVEQKAIKTGFWCALSRFLLLVLPDFRRTFRHIVPFEWPLFHDYRPMETPERSKSLRYRLPGDHNSSQWMLPV